MDDLYILLKSGIMTYFRRRMRIKLKKKTPWPQSASELLVVRVPGYRSGGPGFDSRHYKKGVGLEWGPLSLVSTTEELLGSNSSDSCLEIREYRRRDSLRWPRGTLYQQNVGTNFAYKLRSLGRSDKTKQEIKLKMGCNIHTYYWKRSLKFNEASFLSYIRSSNLSSISSTLSYNDPVPPPSLSVKTLN
jgi:hypothetical protein